MSAFVRPLNAPTFNSRGVGGTRVCQRRPAVLRVATDVRFSLTTNEAPRIDEPTAPIPPPRSEPQPPSRPDRQRGRGPPRPTFEIDPNATYYTTCGNCQAAYEIQPEQLGPRGSKVQCSVCNNVWFQRLDRLSVLKETEGFKDYPMERKDELIAQRAQARSERAARGGRRERRRSEHRVFVGNLPFSCSEEQLQELLQSANVEIDGVKIITDADGRSRGFAFAEVRSREDVDRLVETLDGTEVNGRNVSVKVGK